MRSQCDLDVAIEIRREAPLPIIGIEVKHCADNTPKLPSREPN
jgi:hypothetical protein